MCIHIQYGIRVHCKKWMSNHVTWVLSTHEMLTQSDFLGRYMPIFYIGLVNSRQWLDQDHCSASHCHHRLPSPSIFAFTPLTLLSSADSTISLSLTTLICRFQYVTLFGLHSQTRNSTHTHAYMYIHAHMYTLTCIHTRKAEYIAKLKPTKAQIPLVTISKAQLYTQAIPHTNQSHTCWQQHSHNPHCSGFCLGWSLGTLWASVPN